MHLQKNLKKKKELLRGRDCAYFKLPRLHKPLIFVSSSAPLEGSQVWAPSLKWAIIDFQWAAGGEQHTAAGQAERAAGSTMLFSLTATKACGDPRSIKQQLNKPQLLAGHLTAAPSPTPPVRCLEPRTQWVQDGTSSFALAPWMNHRCRWPTLT